MTISNLLKMSVVAAVLLLSCGAFAQDQAEAPIATIECDDPQTLQLFLDWTSIRASVRRSFEEQGMEMPAGLEDWLAEIRGRMTIEEHMIVVRPEGADKRQAQDFVDELFHVFRNSVFRQHSIERLNQQIQQLQKEAYESRGASIEDIVEWREPQQIIKEYLEVKDSLYQLDLNSARTHARLGALQERIEQRIEEHKDLAGEQTAAVKLQIGALQKALEGRRAELEGRERLFEKEFISAKELRAHELQLLELESALAAQTAILESLRLGRGDDTIRRLKDALIESESELAVGIATRELVEKRLDELQQKLHLVDEQARREDELTGHSHKLSEAKHRIEQGGPLPLTPIEGLPQLRLRWVN